MTESPSIAVLVVDDSRSARAGLARILSGAPDISIIGLAANPYEAVEIMRERAPDVIVLDLEMPRMDGLTFLRKIMAQHPLPVVVWSAHVGPGSQQAVLALEEGAVDLLPKPAIDSAERLEEVRESVLCVIRAAAQASVDVVPRDSARAATRAAGTRPRRPTTVPAAADRGVVVIGASTGGPPVLLEIMAALDPDTPGIVVAQHMPPGFTAEFAKRLDQLCPLDVSEARDGDRIQPGRVLVARGDRHIEVRSGPRPRVVLTEMPRVNGHRPSVDVLFRSAAEQYGPGALGILLTGMGRDGAAGLAEMRNAGARTVAQDESTSAVFGMPAAAIELGGASQILPAPDLADAITRWTNGLR